MTPCKSWRTASGSRSLEKPQGRSTSANRPFSLIPFAAGSVLFGEPGGPEQEGNDMAFRPLHDRVVVKRDRGRGEGEERSQVWSRTISSANESRRSRVKARDKW